MNCECKRRFGEDQYGIKHEERCKLWKPEWIRRRSSKDLTVRS